MRSSLLAAAALGLLPSLGWASSQDCFYNGEKYDDRYDRPKHFTGEYTCKDHDSGKLVLRERHVDGEKDGPFAKYDDRTGQLSEEGGYRRGKLHGVLKRYQQGQQVVEYNYADGEIHGVQKEFRDGIVSRVYLALPTGRRGTPMPDTDFSLNKRGQPMGLECGTEPVGREDAAWCGRDGKQSTVKLYDDEGRLRATEQYLWGRRHGTFTRYHVVSGKVLSEEKYENGTRLADGERRYDAEGQVAFKTDCDQKRAHCTETRFFEGGQEPRTVAVYQGGKLQRRTEYFQNGKPREDLVAEGDRFRIVRSDDEGRVRSKGTYVLSSRWYGESYVPDGVVETFDGDGELWRRETYRAGDLDGPSMVQWTVDGHRVRQEGVYQKDRLLKQKVFVDDQAVEELEYLPDGSLKSKKKLAPAPIEI